MAEGRRKFPEEFKREAVKLASQPGVTVSSVARDLGVDLSVVPRWVEKSRAGKRESQASKPLKLETAAELERVKRELAKVRMERDILKKALGYFAKDPT